MVAEEDNDGRINILGCNCSKSNEHLCSPDFRRAVDRVCRRTSRGSWVAGHTLELGAGAAPVGGDRRLGAFFAHHGRAMDLGIFLASFRTLVGIRRNRGMDSPGFLQFLAEFSINLIFRASCQTR